VRPCKLSELELEVASLESSDEEDEPYDALLVFYCIRGQKRGVLTKDIEKEADKSVVRC
jgi:hypothetical protein